jgi:PTH1 family peptidyl-tRNA hydrolase
MKLIVGLGNPGHKYQNNRHNIGFQILDELDVNFKLEKKFKAKLYQGDNFILAKPQTFMNNSGQAVKSLKTFYKIKPEDIIVIHDDLDLPIGTIRISQGSSSGGNKGIDSIITETGTKEFVRLRIGVANAQRDKIPADKFVLQNFSPADKKILKNLTPQILDALKMLINEGPLTDIQNKFN